MVTLLEKLKKLDHCSEYSLYRIREAAIVLVQEVDGQDTETRRTGYVRLAMYYPLRKTPK